MKARILCCFCLLAVLSGSIYAQTKGSCVELCRAAALGDIALLKRMLSVAENVRQLDTEGNPALYYAVRTSKTEAAEILLKAGADGINQLYEFGTPSKPLTVPLLSFAALLKNIDMVRLLLAYGADIKLLSPDGRDALADAIAGGEPQIVQILLEAGSDPNHALPSGLPPAGLASLQGSVDSLRALLNHGADANWRDVHGITLLMLAAEMGNADVIQVLLEKKAPIHALDAWGKNALAHAKFDENLERRERTAMLLRKAGAKDRNALRPEDAELFKAAQSGDVQKVAQLVAKGADVNTWGSISSDVYSIQTNALSIAVKHPKVCRLLIEKGFNLKMRTPFDFTPLHDAAVYGVPETIEILAAKGVDPNAMSKSGMSPLFMALNGNTKLPNVEALLKAGARPDGPTIRRGEGMIQFARAQGKQKIADILAEAEASRKEKNPTRPQFPGVKPLF
ncbi:MAG TPA: ankyrin repeat domain-containing protein [Rhodocyclaceae bacterium]|nr:ankyrin repeat domain-containing protein [Rhodocyclaceae bacterium]